MRRAEVFVCGISAGMLEEENRQYVFSYHPEYSGAPISLTMPTKTRTFHYEAFPPFFEGLLPEGIQLEALLRTAKLDKKDYLGQLLEVGNDLVGTVSIRCLK